VRAQTTGLKANNGILGQTLFSNLIIFKIWMIQIGKKQIPALPEVNYISAKQIHTLEIPTLSLPKTE
jgi:hypothetical protein